MPFTSIDAMQSTRGGLVPGTIVKLTEPGSTTPASGPDTAVKFMFNPFQYVISKSNTYSPQHVVGQNVPNMIFQQGGARSLTVDLFFDTYPEALDVRTFTKPLFKMMEVEPVTNAPADAPQYSPPTVAFIWGSVFFPGVLTSVTETFTLFLPTGIPVRADVKVSIQEIHLDPNSLRQAEARAENEAKAAAVPPKASQKMERGAMLSAIRANLRQSGGG